MKQAITIIGAGVTGLSAAYKLSEHQQDNPLIVLERDQAIGGMAKSIRWRGCVLDLGPHRFYTEIPGIEQFVRDLCSDRFVRVRRRSRMYLRGKFLQYPVNLLEVAKSFGLRSTGNIALSAARTLLSKRVDEPKTYSDYICRRFGKELHEFVFGPYARKVWGCDPAHLEAETAVVRLRGDSIWHSLLDILKGKGNTYVAQFMYPAGGIGEIARRLAKRTGEAALMLGTGESYPAIENGRCVGVQSEFSGFHASEAVLSTIPLPALAKKIFEPGCPAYAAASNLRFRALVILFLLYDSELELEDTWLYFPESEIPFTRIYIPENFHPDTVPAGKSVLCLEFPCEAGDETFIAGEDILRARADRHLSEIGLARCDATAGLVVRLAEGYPVYSLGYRRHLATILDALRAVPNLITAGRQGLFRHNNLDQAIQMGLLAGEHLCRFRNESHRWYSQIGQFDNYRIVD